MVPRRDSNDKQTALERIVARWSAVLRSNRSRAALEKRLRVRSSLRRVMLRALAREVDTWSALTCGNLRERITEPLGYEGEIDGVPFQAEVQMLEDEPAYVHVSVSVDDGNRWATKPFTHNFLVYTDGRVDK